MEDRQVTDKLLVVADGSGNVLSAAWPGGTSEGAPTETGLRLSDGQTAHEVDVPGELHELARPDLGNYRLQADGGAPALVRDDK